jgi:hypothetical protein
MTPLIYIPMLSPFFFQSNSPVGSVHDSNTKYKNQLHIPLVRLNAIQRGTTYLVIKIYVNCHLILLDQKNSTLSNYLLTHLFLFYRRVNIKLLLPHFIKEFFNQMYSFASSSALTTF